MAFNVRNYIHIYMGLFNNKIYFGNYMEEKLIGESLLSFLYADIESMKNKDFISITDFKNIHPYFMLGDIKWQNAFIENLKSKTSDLSMPSLDDMIRLQQKYIAIVVDLFGHGTYDRYDISEKIQNYKWVSQEGCYAKITLTTSTVKNICMEDYFISSLEECLFVELIEMIKRKIILKKCKNCGKLFVPRRSTMEYCTRIFANGKTCQEAAYLDKFTQNVESDDLLLAYTRAYKAHYARMSKPRKKAANLTREQFDEWYHIAKQKLTQARAGLIDKEEFKRWLKQ